jgi:hypothetical protein
MSSAEAAPAVFAALGDPTRLELVRKAATAGVALLNNQTTIGLWVFSTKLTRTTDYRELVAPGPAGELVGGVPRRQAIAEIVKEFHLALEVILPPLTIDSKQALEFGCGDFKPATVDA